ncbi:MAG: DUF3159 domain-containing protein [Nocardiaceae bacterium]|nr:DUF3159 domain-containing protein [Nocardiaceae bacterium]
MTDQGEPTLMEQMGGVSGLVYSSLPVAVFIPVNLLSTLNVALISALGVAAAIMLWRLVRRENLTPAISGFIGVGISALIAHLLGEARGFYLYGIVLNLFWGVAFTVSILVRRPLAGVMWTFVKGMSQDWRHDRRALRAYDIATAVWAVSFLARGGVQSWLYVTNQATLLGIVKMTGWVITALATLVTIWAVRRAGHTEPKPQDEDQTTESQPSVG